MSRALCCLLFACACHAAQAQGYPTRTIRVLVGFTPGGTTDVVARVIAQKLSEQLRQSVVIDNRPGAGANIAAELAAKAPPDGHTLLAVNPGLAISATLYSRLGYNAQRDLAPVARLADSSHLLIVHPSVPARSVKELVAFARSRPGQLNYSSSGVGNADHFAGELFKSLARVDLVHVPYKGGAQAAQDTVSGQVAMYFSGILVGLPLAKEGKVRSLAVATAKRSPLAPDIPTIAEAGVPGYEMTLWNAMFAPAATPKDMIARLSSEIRKALQSPDVQERLASLGAVPGSGTPEEFGAYFRSEIEKFGKIVRATGMKVE